MRPSYRVQCIQAGVGLSARVGADQVVAQQLVEGVEVVVDHRLEAAVL